MRAKLCLLVTSLAGVGLLGCSGSKGGELVGQDENSMTFATEEFDVPVGDVFECFYTDTKTDRELAVYGANGLQAQGGHHIMVFYTDVEQPVQHHPCKDSEMVSWHQIAGSAGQDAAGDVLALKENLAIKVPPGKQLVLQAHYINTTGTTYRARDTVTLKLLKREQVAGYVNYFVLNDDKFEIPAHAKHTSTTYCKVPQDLDLVLTLGHEHEQGKHYKLDELDEKGNLVRNLRDDAWSPEYTSHPAISYYPLKQPLHLKKGTILRQTCDWENDKNEKLIFPREMCVGFNYYYPGVEDIACNVSKDM